MEQVLVLESDINVSNLSKKILKNEPKIIRKYPPRGYDGLIGDGQTGLGFDSLTSRYYHFNVLNWWGTGQLKKYIRKGYEIYTKIKNRPLYVQCWANVMRKGDQIKSHYHDEHYLPPSMLCGHLCVKVDGLTSTYYDGTPLLNVNREMVFFPANMSHWTDRYMGDSERITVAFDIRSKENYESDVYDNSKYHWIKI
tara:strand:- start:150 stop:737 length:588 start_codon:yes stop_codon:yes gene_type:complete